MWTENSRRMCGFLIAVTLLLCYCSDSTKQYRTFNTSNVEEVLNVRRTALERLLDSGSLESKDRCNDCLGTWQEYGLLSKAWTIVDSKWGGDTIICALERGSTDSPYLPRYRLEGVLKQESNFAIFKVLAESGDPVPESQVCPVDDHWVENFRSRVNKELFDRSVASQTESRDVPHSCCAFFWHKLSDSLTLLVLDPEDTRNDQIYEFLDTALDLPK